MRRPLDALTDREQEVLTLVRLGLTNEEIAQRLGISLDGAKYHVSQILSKLGVGSREEAAAVVGEERRRWWLAAPLWAKVASATTVVAVAGGLGVLIFGALQSQSEAELTRSSTPTDPVKVVPPAMCEDLPTAVLRTADSAQAGFASATNWHDDTCSLDAHGFGETTLQPEPFLISRASSPTLQLSRSPTSVSIGAWTPNFASPTPLVLEDRVEIYEQDGGRNQIPIRVNSEQRLDLAAVPNGEQVIQVVGRWPGGQRIFVFRVAVED